MLLFACASEPTEKGFIGSGSFDKEEAAKTRVSLGLTYLKNGNFSQAKFNLDKALEFAPRSGKANFAMAFYYQQVDEVKRAYEYYKQAISLSSSDPDILNSYGAFLCEEGDYEQAKKYFLKAVDDKSYISTASTYENLAICSENQGKIDEAITYFNSALNHQPTRPTSLLYVSQLYVKTERWEEAKKSLWKYERNASVSSESLWLSFQIAQGLQDLRASVEYADILKRLYPSDPNTQKAINALGKFQPGMSVTQKNRSVPKEVEGVALANNVGQQDTADNKVTRVMVPASERVSTAVAPAVEVVSTIDMPIPETQDSVEYIDDSPIETSNIESDTEIALKNALDNTDALLDNEPVATEPELASEIVDSVEETLESSEPAVADALPNVPSNANTPFHIVLPKENMYRISLKYNVKIKKLLEWNNLKDESSVMIGTKLWVRDPNINE